MCMYDIFGGGKGLDEIAYERSSDNGSDIRDLEDRLEQLEEYLGLEWREDKGKYFEPSKPAHPKTPSAPQEGK